MSFLKNKHSADYNHLKEVLAFKLNSWNEHYCSSLSVLLLELVKRRTFQKRKENNPSWLRFISWKKRMPRTYGNSFSKHLKGIYHVHSAVICTWRWKQHKLFLIQGWMSCPGKRLHFVLTFCGENIHSLDVSFYICKTIKIISRSPSQKHGDFQGKCSWKSHRSIHSTNIN